MLGWFGATFSLEEKGEASFLCMRRVVFWQTKKRKLCHGYHVIFLKDGSSLGILHNNSLRLFAL